ncbi:MAG: hypothetical protein LC714_06125 [Actinobacteria bacterium]|nr:hypothetical protein [Actinomycetota bacterium]
MQAEGCKNPSGSVFDITNGTDDRLTRFFDIDTEAFQIKYDVDPDGDTPVLEIEVRDEDNQRVEETILIVGDESGKENAIEGPGAFRLKILEQDAKYDIIVRECKGNNPADDNNNGGNNDGGSAGDGTTDGTTDTTDTTGVVPAQADTTGTTTGTADPATTDPTATADAAIEDAGVANRDGSFRCESFLHVVRDEDGALRSQYRDGDRDDELIVQRFEQCLEADVLADTIPEGRLPFTGGPSLPFGGGVLLLVTAAVLVGRMIRR